MHEERIDIHVGGLHGNVFAGVVVGKRGELLRAVERLVGQARAEGLLVHLARGLKELFRGGIEERHLGRGIRRRGIVAFIRKSRHARLGVGAGGGRHEGDSLAVLVVAGSEHIVDIVCPRARERLLL